jgi:hypothetical protein
MKFAFRQGLALLMGLALLVACGDSPPATPTPEPTATEPTVAATQLPEPTAALAPTNTPEPAPTVAPSTSTTANCENRAGNVRDATVPDDTPFKPGVTFVKTWRIKNVGTCTWGAGYTVVFSVGDNMSIAPQNANGTPIPSTPPGADAEVSLNLQASFKVGKYKGFWLLRAPDGKTFGTGSEGNIPFWVQIIVKR